MGINVLIAFVVGVIVGVVAFYFVYRNNKKKIDAKLAEMEEVVKNLKK
jgi:uncharacterized membrane-anchored protein YhcB (DUF1043 family)